VQGAIVVGYDGSDGARDACTLGMRLAAAAGRPLALVCVRPLHIPEWAPDAADNEQLVVRRAQAALDAAPVGGDVERRLVAEDSVALGLQRFAEGIEATAVVVGCPDRAHPGRIDTGTVAERLLHGSPCAVALAPRGYAEDTGQGFRRIVVAYTPTDEARAALRAAAGLARACDAVVQVVSVKVSAPAWTVEVPSYDASALASLQADLDRSLRALASSVAVEGEVLEGDPVERLLERASGSADLIVAGSRGHGRARQVLLGSVSARLLAGARVPVIVTPRGADTELVAGPPSLAAAGR